MDLTRKHIGLLILPLLLMQAAPALATSPDNPAVAPVVERQLSLSMSPEIAVQLKAEPASWQGMGQVTFTSATGPAPSPQAATAVRVLRTGALSWRITARGAHVVDNRTGSSADIPELTSMEVRPGEVAYDARKGMVWFYGAGLYRYHVASHTLEKLHVIVTGWQTIRKASLGQSGLWLAATKGVFLLDASDGQLKKLESGAAINIVAGEKDVWAATADKRLLRITVAHDNQLVLSTSKVLPGGVAEMAQGGSSLWLLFAARHGENYSLAFVDEGHQDLKVMSGRYFTLGREGAALLAGAYGRQYRIDPVDKTVTPVSASEAGLLTQAQQRGAVLFAGYSYGVQDGCEVVEHAQLDLSKGWVDALNEARGR